VTVEISVVICTLHRPLQLRLALRSVLAQTLAPDRYEILIVDNGSSVETERLVQSEFSGAVNLRYIREGTLGLSSARNTGWQQACGEYVAYLDDDATACPRWLEIILRLFEGKQGMPGCVGGKIDLVWEVPPPSWLSPELMGYLGRVDWSDIPCQLPENQWLGGGNIAFPRHLLAEIGGFKNQLGRIGAKLLSSEEILVRQQLEARGHGCFYDPEIQVSHYVPMARMTRAWFRRRCYWQGVSNALLQVHRDVLSRSTRLRIAGRELVRLLASPRRLVDLGCPVRDSACFLRQCGEISRVGYVAGLLGRV
jgi:glycosyltransferase involved in cell wall biosynthesis